MIAHTHTLVHPFFEEKNETQLMKRKGPSARADLGAPEQILFVEKTEKGAHVETPAVSKKTPALKKRQSETFESEYVVPQSTNCCTLNPVAQHKLDTCGFEARPSETPSQQKTRSFNLKVAQRERHTSHPRSSQERHVQHSTRRTSCATEMFWDCEERCRQESSTRRVTHRALSPAQEFKVDCSVRKGKHSRFDQAGRVPVSERLCCAVRVKQLLGNLRGADPWTAPI